METPVKPVSQPSPPHSHPTAPGGIDRASPDDGKKLVELGYLCSAVSHHVINAFSSIVSNAELIRTQGDGPPTSAELEESGTAIVDTALEASKVARKLIDWARRATAIEVERDAPLVDLNQLVQEKLESVRPLAPGQIEWVLNLNPVSPIPGNFGGLGAMLDYLMQNAREALPNDAGTIEISTYTDAGNRLVLAIRDTGCGMSPEVLKRATEPFFSTKPDHSGVGLAIAQGIWRRHRGSLSIDSRPGAGTTIRLSIGPIAPPRTVASA